MMRAAMWALVCMSLCGAATRGAAADLSLGRVTAHRGQPVTIPVGYSGKGALPAAALGTEIKFNPAVLSHPRCAPGAALATGSTGKTVKCTERGRGVVRLAVFGLNLDAVPSGEVATITFDVAPSAQPKLYRLRHKPSAADANGTDFSLNARSGAVRVGQR